MILFSRNLSLPPGRLSPGPLPLCFCLAALVTAVCVQLWPEWRHDPDLSHGFFAPLVFGLLLWESRRLGPLRWVNPGFISHVILALLCASGVALFAFAGLFAASLAWTHALVLFLLTAALVCFLLGGLLILADVRLRILPANWITFTAIMLWILVAPVPDGTYARLTLTLQNWMTDGVMAVLQFLGVPARQHGNVIALAQATIGVEEACSGVRSLLSCLYVGFFLAAWQVRKPLRRLGLILAAPVLALGMNFIRSLSLTLLANSGVVISRTWHDATGLAVLGLTATLLAGLALFLETKDSPPETKTDGSTPDSPLRWPYRIFWFCTGMALSVAAFFYLNSRPSRQSVPDNPPLSELLPAVASGWSVATPTHLYQFAGILQTNHLLERRYARPDGKGGIVELTAYVAYWAPGQTTVSRVASHTPDACWPGSGWAAHPTADGPAQSITMTGLELSPAEHRIFSKENTVTQHVWFWHIFDGRVLSHRDPYSLPALLQLSLQYGFRRQGSQYFIRLSSNRPWNELADEPLLRTILTQLDRIGL